MKSEYKEKRVMDKFVKFLQDMDAEVLKTELLSFVEDENVEIEDKHDFADKFCDFITDDLTKWL